MRILQILPELRVGGVETGTVDFSRYLVDHGHHSVVVSNGGALVADLEKAGSRHYRLPVHKKTFWTILKCIKAVRKIIRDERIQIVHARSRVPGWIAYFACRSTDAQFITTCHGHYSLQPFSWVMGWSKLVIVPSEAIGRHMVDSFKVSPEHIRIIPRSVDLERFRYREKDKKGRSEHIVSIVGRLTPLKGHTYFLRAMAKALRSMPYVKIWIIGDAPVKKESYKQELMILARRLGLAERVEFLGNRRDIPELMAQSDVVVMSSVTPESFGRVILEGQAMGTPVVATRVGGVVDIVDDGRTGLLVLPKDTDAMAEAILRLLKDRAFAGQLVENARAKLLECFTLKQMAESTLSVYQELMGMLNILVIKLSAVGDVVLVTASLKAIRKKYPQAKIYCLVGEACRKVLQRCPYIDELIVMDINHCDKGCWRLVKFSRKLRRYKFDKIVDFQNNCKSHVLSALAFPRESYGYDNGKFGWLLSHAIKNSSQPLQPVEHQFKVLEMLGITYAPDSFLELWPSESDKRYVQKLLESEWIAESMDLVGINLSASPRWESKNWPLEHIAKLCDILAAKNIRVVVTGTDLEKEKAREVCRMAKTRPADFVGKTDVVQLAALIKRCRVFVTPDSAPMHIAAAVKTPFIALFGPTASSRHLPPAKRSVILERQLICAPCYCQKCKSPEHACLAQITPEDVVKNIERLMDKTS